MRVRRLARRASIGAAVMGGVCLVLAMAAGPAGAQSINIELGEGAGLTERAIQLVALITVLSLAPSILVMVTSFTRIVVVLSLLRTAIGLQTAPPNSVMIALALFLTAYIMAPAFQTAYDDGIRPLVDQEIEIDEAFQRSVAPFRTFMLGQVREKDLALFSDMAQAEQPANPEDVELRVLIPAFMISELRRAFEIGFLLFIPFIVIDMVVASILMSMGMMMLPPIIISTAGRWSPAVWFEVSGWGRGAAPVAASLRRPASARHPGRGASGDPGAGGHDAGAARRSDPGSLLRYGLDDAALGNAAGAIASGLKD
jgi:flagellar biosynthetic protein FliP